MRVLVVRVFLTLIVSQLAHGADDVPPKPTSHDTRNLEGWTVHIDERLLEGADKPLGDRALRLLANRLFEINLVLPAEKSKRLRQVPIWIDRTHGSLTNAQYHPSADWLKEQGYSEKLAKCVHIPNAELFASLQHQRIQPWSVLHELAHAYHDQVLGFDDAQVERAWKSFCDSGKYESVLYTGGPKKRHYALTNAKEFFAELTESLFGMNDFYPFNRPELRDAEPETYRMLCEIWGVKP